MIITQSTTLKALAFITILSLAGCKKKDDKEEDKVPSASFTTDKAEYLAGETIHITNTSTDGDTYRWTLPDGQTSKDANIDYAMKESAFDQPAIFKLEAFSKNGTKSDYTVKTIPVKGNLGKLTTYFVGYLQAGGVSYQIDGSPNPPGWMTFTSYLAPVVCDQPGYPTIVLKIGAHTLKITNGSDSKEYNFQITANNCTIIKLEP